MSTVTCPSCSANCTPRLWHHTPMFGAVRYMKTQHICPLCGIVMYETGGQINVFGKFAGVFFLGLAISVAMAIAGISGSEFVLTGVFALLINAAVFYGIYKVFRKTFGRTSKK